MSQAARKCSACPTRHVSQFKLCDTCRARSRERARRRYYSEAGTRARQAYQRSDARKVVARRYSQSAKGRAAQARQNASEGQRAAKARFKKTEKGRAAARRYYRSVRARHPEKVTARQKVMAEIRAGRMKRQPCRVCNLPDAEAHHRDYSQPLEVDWLCPTHHDKEHGHARRAQR